MVTVWFMKNILEYSRGLNVTIDRNTTLNEKFNVMKDAVLDSRELPLIRYYGLGVGGTGSPVKNGYHNPVDGCLFEHIPFIIRPIAEDISGTERLKYRIRTEQVINGKNYAVYYLKVLDDNVDLVNIKVLDKVGDTNSTTVSRFDTNNPLILNPIPSVNTELDLNKSRFHVVESNMSLTLNPEDKDEIINAYKLMYNTTNIPMISEIGLFTGKDVIAPNGGMESIAARAAYFYAVPYEIQGIVGIEGVTQRYINIGGMRLY